MLKTALWVFSCIILLIAFFFSSPIANAATYQGTTPSGASGTFEADGGNCSNFETSSGETSLLTPDLSACSGVQGDPNYCCTGNNCPYGLGQWQYRYATGCLAQVAGFGGICVLDYQYVTQTCPATDTCYASAGPYLNPGLCTTSGCAVSGTQYKTCCTSTGQLAPFCSGGQYSGSCGSYQTVRCGDNGIPCGAAACATLGPTCLQDECTVEGAQWCSGSTTSVTCVRKSQPNPACSPNTYLAVSSTTCPPTQTCQNGQGCIAKTCTVDILANPQGISRGEETRLAWFSSNASSCSISTVGTVSVNGERTVSPNQTTTYSITCSPAAGTSCSDNVRVTVSSGGGIGPCPGGECTAGQANTKQCAGSASYQTCQLDPTRGRYCWTAQPCPNGQTCTGAGTCGCPASNPFSCNNTCWTNPCPFGISCQASGAVCNPTPTPTPTTPIPTPTPTPTPPPSCGPVVLGPDCLNPCSGQRSCNYSNRFLYFACTGDSVCLSQELDDTCIGQANNCAATSISGSVFLDTNQDGTKQATEALYGGSTNVTAQFSPGPYAPGYCSGWAGSYNSCMRDYMQICDEFGGQERTRCIAEAEGYCGPCKYPPRPTGQPVTPPPPQVTSIGPGQYRITSPTAGEDLPTGTYTVTYQPPGTYQTTEPTSGNSFAVIVGPGCSPGASKNASCFGGSVNNLHFGLLASNPWFQSTGADLRVDSGFSADIPANATCGAYASLAGAGGSPGIIYSGTRGGSFGGGSASQTNWTAGGATYPESYTPTRPGLIRTSYNYLLSVAKLAAITPVNILSYCGPGGLGSCTLPASLPNGLYIANGNLTLTGSTYTFPANKNFVILVGGDLNIRQRILVPNGSTATFSSSGDITVERSVGQAVNSSTAPDVEGFYSADKNFIADGVNNCGVGADLRLNIAGAVVVNAALGGGSFQNNRDLCEGNAQCPAFAVSERPDFVLNAPEFIKHPSFIWQESAP